MKPTYKFQDAETPIKNAPPVKLNNGEHCIPQHYLQYQHTRKSVEQLIVNIDYDNRYLAFVCEDKGGIYLQIGIVSFDNYRPLSGQNKKKIVYGRKWRVEPQLPTSEIIQTVFLAIKKAREHEVRELFQLKYQQRITTPFNNHHDLPLMARNRELVEKNKSPERMTKPSLWIKWLLKRISYDSASLMLNCVEQCRNGKWVVDINILADKNSQLPEVGTTVLSLLLSNLSTDEVYFQLMESLIALSNRHVDEHFRYCGFARFSQQNSIEKIAALSSTLRQIDNQPQYREFLKTFEQVNYETDRTRVPKLYGGELGEKIRSSLLSFGQLEGILPG